MDPSRTSIPAVTSSSTRITGGRWVDVGERHPGNEVARVAVDRVGEPLRPVALVGVGGVGTVAGPLVEPVGVGEVGICRAVADGRDLDHRYTRRDTDDQPISPRNWARLLSGGQRPGAIPWSPSDRGDHPGQGGVLGGDRGVPHDQRQHDVHRDEGDGRRRHHQGDQPRPQAPPPWRDRMRGWPLPGAGPGDDDGRSRHLRRYRVRHRGRGRRDGLLGHRPPVGV